MNAEFERDKFHQFVEMVRASPHNLMSPRALDEIWERHIAEAVALTERLPDSLPELLDIGSGGGFPGIVIAILRPGTHLFLVESTTKKAQFLDSVVEDLELSVTVVNDRAEHLHGGELAGRFRAVTARAVAPLKRLVPWAAPFLASGGALYAIKGQRWREELDEAEEAITGCGLEILALPRALQDPVDDVEASAPRLVILGRPPRHAQRSPD